MYVSLTTDRSVCFAFTPLFKRLAATLHDGSAAAVLATEAHCVLCSLQEQVEEAALQAWLRSGGEPAQWGGICLPHLRTVARHPDAQVRLARWSQQQGKALERLVEDMQRYVLKRDAIRRGLTTKEETDAAARVVAFLAAHRVVLADARPCRNGAGVTDKLMARTHVEKVDGAQ
jgi:hypothetical protein